MFVIKKYRLVKTKTGITTHGCGKYTTYTVENRFTGKFFTTCAFTSKNHEEYALKDFAVLIGAVIGPNYLPIEHENSVCMSGNHNQKVIQLAKLRYERRSLFSFKKWRMAMMNQIQKGFVYDPIRMR